MSLYITKTAGRVNLVLDASRSVYHDEVLAAVHDLASFVVV